MTAPTRPRVLILGATGMLGHKLCDVLGPAPELDVHATRRGSGLGARDSGLGLSAGARRAEAEARDSAKGTEGTKVCYHDRIDLSRGTTALVPLLERLQPDVIVNAIGAIKHRDLRSAVDETFFINTALPHELAVLNPNRAGRVIHVSTDCVFVGDRGAYREADAPDATDIYGRSKAAGELDYGPHLTLRTSIVGFERQAHLGMLAWFFSQPRGATVPGYTHAIYSGLPTVTLARLIRGQLATAQPLTGLYHVASEPIPKYDLLLRLNETFGRGVHLVPDGSVRIDRSLDDSRFRSVTGTVRPGWDELLAELKQDYIDHGYEAVYEARRNARAAVTEQG